MLHVDLTVVVDIDDRVAFFFQRPGIDNGRTVDPFGPGRVGVAAEQQKGPAPFQKVIDDRAALFALILFGDLLAHRGGVRH